MNAHHDHATTLRRDIQNDAPKPLDVLVISSSERLKSEPLLRVTTVLLEDAYRAIQEVCPDIALFDVDTENLQRAQYTLPRKTLHAVLVSSGKDSHETWCRARYAESWSVGNWKLNSFSPAGRDLHWHKMPTGIVVSGAQKESAWQAAIDYCIAARKLEGMFHRHCNFATNEQLFINVDPHEQLWNSTDIYTAAVDILLPRSNQSLWTGDVKLPVTGRCLAGRIQRALSTESPQALSYVKRQISHRATASGIRTCSHHMRDVQRTYDCALHLIREGINEYRT